LWLEALLRNACKNKKAFQLQGTDVSRFM